MMNERIAIKHQDFSADQLTELINTKSMPIRRGVHVGNQEPHDLFVECYLPEGVDVLAADSINGNDRDARPRQIRLCDRNVSIAPERYKGKIVGAIPVMEDAHDRIRNHDLQVTPEAGESIGSFHMRAVEALDPNNSPVLVSQFFAAHRALYERVMELAFNDGDVYRSADKIGSIRKAEKAFAEEGIFGLEDDTPAKQGLLPSLNVMMAMDMLTALKQNTDTSLHLGASGMAAYSQDIERMFNVKRLVGAVASDMGMDCQNYTYYVTDITALGQHIDMPDHTSQHELLRSRAGILI